MSSPAIDNVTRFFQTSTFSPRVTSIGERQKVPATGNDLPPERKQSPNKNEVSEAMNTISQYMKSASRELQFRMDESTGGTIITVREAETMEIIRQIPGEQALAIAQYIAERAPDPARGLLADNIL